MTVCLEEKLLALSNHCRFSGVKRLQSGPAICQIASCPRLRSPSWPQPACGCATGSCQMQPRNNFMLSCDAISIECNRLPGNMGSDHDTSISWERDSAGTIEPSYSPTDSLSLSLSMSSLFHPEQELSSSLIPYLSD